MEIQPIKIFSEETNEGRFKAITYLDSNNILVGYIEDIMASRKGMGSILLQKVEGLLKHENVKTIFLEAVGYNGTSNTEAKKFYKKHDYRFGGHDGMKTIN